MKKEEKVSTKKKESNEKKTKKSVKIVSSEKRQKGNIFERISRYFRGVWKELGRIRWTNHKDLVKYSIATVVFVLFFGIYFYGIDWIALLVRSLAN